MQCHELENKLNQLQDARLPLQNDTALAEHTKTCEACRTEVHLHQAMLDGAEMLALPELSEGFTKRVTLAALAQSSKTDITSVSNSADSKSRIREPNSVGQSINTTSTTQTVTPTSSYRGSMAFRVIATLAVAASLFLVVGLGLQTWKNQNNALPTSPITTNGTPNDNVAISTPLLFEHLPTSFPENKLQLVCQSTGRGMASLPQAVRWMANSPEGSVVASHMRPVTQPVGAAFKVLRKSWPSSSSQSSKSSGDTSWITASAPGILC